MGGELDAAGIGAHAALHGFVEGGRLGLKGDMTDAETVAEEGGQVGEDVFGAAGVGHFDVGAEGGEGGSDRPDVDIVEGQDAADFRCGGSDRVGIKAARGTFHEDGPGMAEETEGARDDEGGDREGDKGVEAAPGPESDGEGRDDNGDRAEGIGHGFEGGAADVQVVVGVAVKDAEDEEVDREAGDADGDDRGGIEFGRAAAESAERLEDDVRGDETEEGDVDGDSEHLGAGVAEGTAGVGRAAGDGGGGESEEEPGGIGEHVAGIGDKGEGAREVAGHSLDGDEEQREEEACEEGFSGAIVRRVHGIIVAGGGREPGRVLE